MRCDVRSGKGLEEDTAHSILVRSAEGSGMGVGGAVTRGLPDSCHLSPREAIYWGECKTSNQEKQNRSTSMPYKLHFVDKRGRTGQRFLESKAGGCLGGSVH